jgi:hypothetical protein
MEITSMKKIVKNIPDVIRGILNLLALSFAKKIAINAWNSAFVYNLESSKLNFKHLINNIIKPIVEGVLSDKSSLSEINFLK